MTGPVPGTACGRIGASVRSLTEQTARGYHPPPIARASPRPPAPVWSLLRFTPWRTRRGHALRTHHDSRRHGGSLACSFCERGL